MTGKKKRKLSQGATTLAEAAFSAASAGSLPCARTTCAELLGAAKLGHAILAAHLEHLSFSVWPQPITSRMLAQQRERSIAYGRVLALLGGAREE